MAPFNTHFLIAEKIWPELAGPWQPHYGQFCFGCVAPDVDKVSTVITQRDTHFFDRTGPYELMEAHRTAAFLKHQAEFLCCPFDQLPPAAQAFVLGYLCHLCVDEVSKHMWKRPTWMKFSDVGPGPAFAALDEVARRRIVDYPAIVQALQGIEVLDVIPRIPVVDLQAIHQGALRFVQATTVEAEFLALVDMFDRPGIAERHQKQRQFRAKIETARSQVHIFELDMLVEAGLERSRQRLADLLANRVPAPDFPTLASH